VDRRGFVSEIAMEPSFSFFSKCEVQMFGYGQCQRDDGGTLKKNGGVRDIYWHQGGS